MNNVAVKKNFFKLGGADAADEDRIPFGQAVYASTGASMSIIDYLRTWSADPSANFPSFEYVVIGGIGEEADYAAAGITGATDLSGKIAVVNRGTTTFEEKATVAKAHGAKAVIFVNNVENGGSFAPASSRAMANWLENMNSTSSVRTPSLARKMFWKVL